MDILQSEIDLLRSKEAGGKKQLEEIQNAIDRFDSKLSGKQAEISSNTEVTDNLQQKKLQLDTEIEALTFEEREVSEKLRDLRSKVHESRQASEEMQRHGSVLQSLMSAKRDKLPVPPPPTPTPLPHAIHTKCSPAEQ